jgi:cellulose synthase/poly-beta-1,6-N-acetylglucosamine synthase-like glycosyltransferase
MIVIEILLLTYFVYVVGYTAFFSVAAHFYRLPPLPVHLRYTRFCVMIPAYKEDAVIISSARRALLQFYPKKCYDIVVVADQLKPSTLSTLTEIGVKVVEVHFEQSTKVKALNEAFRQLDNEYDYAVILDADNLMKRDFLRRVNNLIQNKHFKAIQGQRMPKNQENKLSFLDGLSEAINNHIYRKGATAAGLSASINGSGIAIQYNLLKEKLSTMNSIGGFDRELEVLMLREGVKVVYFPEAVVLDEKVGDIGTFQNQRRRWIASQYFYLQKYFGEGMAALVHGDFTFFNSSVLRNIQLPRLLNLFLLAAVTVVMWLAAPWLTLGYAWWPVLFVAQVVAILLAIPGEFYSKRFFASMSELPGVFIRMAILMFKMKDANKKFIHTPHGVKAQES